VSLADRRDCEDSARGTSDASPTGRRIVEMAIVRDAVVGVPLQITFRHLAPSEAIAAKVQERAAKLERFAEHITGCHVVIEAPHRHQHQGTLYHVTIDLVVPGGQLIVNRAPQQHHAHEDAYVAIRDAFDAAIRRLEELFQRRRVDVKHHEETGGDNM
jgi:ribosomal subunit interface protein